MKNTKQEWDWGRESTMRRTDATGTHEQPTGTVQDGYTRSEIRGVKDRYMDDGVRQEPSAIEGIVGGH